MTQSPTSRVVAHPITMRCVDPLGISRDLATTFEYDPKDPYAVVVAFPAGDAVIRWAFCRTLISRGLTDPVGEGDVQVWPSTDEHGRGVVILEFRSPSGHLLAEAPTRELYRFITRSLALVPYGSEAAHLDVDELIADLLGSSQPE
jgi:Streptomyces sporulation and cell division protein, SsgA